jgi:hypothetical protein
VRKIITWRSAPAIAVASLAIVLAGLGGITEPVAANGGVGWDGVNYRDVVNGLRTGTPTSTDSPFNYRILPSGLVALSGLDVVHGFLVLDAAAIFATGLLILALLRPWTTPLAAIVAVVAWGLLPYGLRFAVHDAVLPDALGTFLLLAVFYAANERRWLWFAIALVAAVLTRENLVVLAPLLALRYRQGGVRMIGRGLTASVPAGIALALVHIAPPIHPLPGMPTTVDYIAFRFHSIATNLNGATWRLLAGPFFGLGALLGPLLSRTVVRVINSEPGWAYLVATSVLTSALGGGDHDRYIAATAAIFMLIAVRSIPADSRTALLMLLLGLQLLAVRLVDPLGSDTSSHENFMIATTSLDRLVIWSLTIAFCCAVLAIMFARSRRTPEALGVTPGRP